MPAVSAPAVQRLIDAGAIPIGKTNLDQFATGLVGTRSPYGVCQNAFDAAYISGGSSSGSAVAVATGLVSFALGTDTAGSGRVPAAFNNLIGYKPTCGSISPRGMVPACRSLDSISIFTLTAEDAALVGGVASGFDVAEPYSRQPPAALTVWPADRPLRFGVPRASQLEFFADAAYSQAFAAAASRLEAMGWQRVEIDLEPFLATARLLYEGPWLAERYAALEDLLRRDPEALHPVTRKVIDAGRNIGAVAAFRGQYRLMELRRATAAVWNDIDVLLTPTTGTTYRINEVLADPLTLNANLGYYTNFVNLLDLAAVAVPAGMTSDKLPFGVSLVAPAWSDAALLRLAATMQRTLNSSLGATGCAIPKAGAVSATETIAAAEARVYIDVMVCGAHMSNLPLNKQLTERHATLKSRTRTADCYRFFALPGGPPFRPGLVQVNANGVAVEVEVWSVPEEHFGSFVAGIPAPLAIGKVKLADGTQVCGFLCEGYAVSDAVDISALGSWRAYLAQQGR
jgi:allophanate hydrolase